MHHILCMVMLMNTISLQMVSTKLLRYYRYFTLIKMIVTGKQIAFICKLDSSDYVWKTTQQVFITSTSGGGLSQCINSDIDAYSSSPKYTPDGTLAYLQMMQPGYDSDKMRVILYDRKTRKNITEDWPHSAMSLTFSPDSQSIYVTADEQAHLKIFAINCRTEEIKALTHEHTAILVSPSKDGIIFRLASMDCPHLIWQLKFIDYGNACVRQDTRSSVGLQWDRAPQTRRILV
jgi:Tol biopolymer transport system component